MLGQYFTKIQISVDGSVKRCDTNESYTTEELNRSWLENMRQFYLEEVKLGNIDIIKDTPTKLVVEYDGEQGRTTRVYEIGSVNE